MHPMRRELNLKVYAGNKDTLPIIYLIDSHVHADRILEYLYRSGLVGSVLVDFYSVRCKGEPIRFLGIITKKILNLNTAPALIKGLNFR